MATAGTEARGVARSPQETGCATSLGTTQARDQPSPSGVTPYRCARGEHCPQAELVETDHCAGDCECHLGPHYSCSVPGGCGHLHRWVQGRLGAKIMHSTGLCGVCEIVVSYAIADLPEDYVSLRMAQHRGISPITSELVSFSKDLPIPISLTFSTLAEQIEVEAGAFVEPVAEKLSIDWDRSTTPRINRHFRQYGRPAYRGSVLLNKASHLLSTAVDILVKIPIWEYRLWGENAWVEVEVDGVGAALTLLSLHSTARAVLGLTKAIVTKQANCPWCNEQSLVQVAGRDFIHCTLCSSQFTEQEYNQWTLVTIGERKCPKKSVRRDRQENEELISSVEGSVGRPTR